MDIIGTTDYSSVIKQTQATDVEKSLKSKDKKTRTDEEMMDACKQFEAYMVEQVYKGMEKTVMRADDEKGDYEKMFDDMRIQQYAKTVTDQGGIGLAQQLYESMKRNTPQEIDL